MNINNNFDPLMWANGEAENISSAPATNTGCDLEVEVRDLVTLIVSRGLDITNGYENWFSLGFALADGLGENGRRYYHELSRMNSGYNPNKCDKQYNACLHSHGRGITISTFFQMAKDAGIDLSQFAREHMPNDFVSATSAIAPSANSIEIVTNNTISSISDNGMADGGLAQMADAVAVGTGYTFSDKLNREDLPGIAYDIYGHCEEPAKRDAQLLGSLNVIGGLLGGANGSPEKRSGIYGVYDGRRVFAPTYNIVYSGAGNDKGLLIYCKLLALPVKMEMRKVYEAEMEKYTQEMAERSGKKDNDYGPMLKEPVYRDPFLPGNSSSSAVYRGLDANGGWGMMFETEADTITAMIDSDYGNYSDLMRKAHHHEAVSMNRVTEKLHIDIAEPRLSIFLTCTPGQLPPLFPSFENGLGSRFLFYNTPDDDVVFHDVFVRKDTPLEDIYKALGERLLPLYHAMAERVDHPIQFVLSQSQQKEFLETYGGILREQFKMLGKGIRAFIFRIALECFRYAMTLTTLRRLGDWETRTAGSFRDYHDIFSDVEIALVCDDRDFRTAMTIIGCLINHTARVYAVLSKEDDNPFAQRGIKLSTVELQLYKDLPAGNFRTSDFIELAAKMNIPERSAQRMLSQMCNNYCIIKPVHRGVYNKPAERSDEASAANV